MAFRIFRFRRFSSQLLLLLAGLIALVQVAVYLLVSRANEKNARQNIERNLQTGARLFRQNLGDRIDALSSSASLMSNDYATRLLLMQDPVDKKTLRSNLQSYVDRVKAPVITIFSAEVELLAMTDDIVSVSDVGPFQTLIRKAADEEMEQASDFAYLDGKLHVLVVVPLYAPRPIVAAWFGVAYPIDAAFAQAIKVTTQLDVTFTSGPIKTKAHVLSTTLNPAMAESVASQMTAFANASGRSETLDLNGEPYVTLFEPLPLLGDSPVIIALQRSLQAELAPAKELEKTVLLISLVALGCATLAALTIARSVSQPVRQLAGFTKLIAAGDYTQRLTLPRADELGQLATSFNQMAAGLAERDKVRDILGKVVSPEIATQLLQSDLKLGGEERDVTILFCDLRDFTALSEKMSPTDMLTVLNRYLDCMSGIIEKNSGVIDKYIGDAIMALYGAPVAMPDAATRALATAREMTDALHDLNQQLHNEGWPRLEFGIGINTGRVVAGNMGSKTRHNYTVIGDGVNLAARLEALTKDPAYGTTIIVSEATAVAAGEKEALRPLGSVTVKGKTEVINILAVDIIQRPWPQRSQ